MGVLSLPRLAVMDRRFISRIVRFTSHGATIVAIALKADAFSVSGALELILLTVP
jgi:hypothetical protein